MSWLGIVLVDSDGAEEQNQLRWPAVCIVAIPGIYGFGSPHETGGQVAGIIFFWGSEISTETGTISDDW